MPVVLHFAVPEPVQVLVRPMMTMLEYICRISKLNQNNDVCIDWPLRTSDMSTVEHV